MKTYPKVKQDGWHKTALRILNDYDFWRRLQALDYDNFNEDTMLEIFILLNTNKLEKDGLAKINPCLLNLIEWCQAVVSYHILIHPFTIRNKSS